MITLALIAGADAGARPTAPAFTARAVAGDTLCTANETRQFSCAIGAKRVSVCRRGASAVYRYGTPGKVELVLRRLTFASRGYSGGGETQITASNGDHTYTVYERTVRTAFGEGGNAPAFSAGLVIARGGRVIASRLCQNGPSLTGDVERALPAGSFVEH